jgi:hypothetical protein
MLFLFVILTAPLLSEEIQFGKDKITYHNFYDNEYNRGEIHFGDNVSPYDKMKITRKGNVDEYMFGINEKVSGVLKNANILPGSRATLIVKNGIASEIHFGYAILGKDNDESSIPFIVESLLLTKDGVSKIENGYFQLNNFFKIDVEQGAIKGLIENWGKRKYYYNENLAKEFSYKVPGVNLEPTLNLHGEMHISPEKFDIKGDVGVSIFSKRIELGGTQFPDFLTKGNPYKISGEISFDKLTNVFRVSTSKEINSGNIVIRGTKEAFVTADIQNFGARLRWKGELEYDVKDVAAIMDKNNCQLKDVLNYSPNIPVDEALMVWSLQFFMTDDEVRNLANSNKELKKSVDLNITIGYDPEKISKGKDYLDFNVLKVDIEFDGKSKKLEY